MSTPEIRIAEPFIGKDECGAALRALTSGRLAVGPEVKAFEEEFALAVGVKHAVAVANGTVALHLALHALGVGPGDEVITTPLSFGATAQAILYCGATPVFVDIDPLTFNLDPSQIASKITPRTKAILPVHLYGHPADMPSILEVAQAHGLAVIEDAAQAHGASIDHQVAGSFGDAGCFSFYATKNMTTGEGGMITTNSPSLDTRLRRLRMHGMDRLYHYVELGWNGHMSEMEGAIGRIQLQRLGMFVFMRRANAGIYDGLLRDVPGIVLPHSQPGYRHAFHQYTLRVADGRRDELREWLARWGVESMVYYPEPLHQVVRQPAVCPEAERACAEVLSIPVHPKLSIDNIEYVGWLVKKGLTQ